VLSCSHCTKPCGAKVLSNLVLADCPEGSVIGNDQGALVCPPAHGEDIPDGTYKDSCAGCAVSEGTLTCTTCARAEGTPPTQEASFVLGTCERVGNTDGQLVCDDAEAANMKAQIDAANEPLEFKSTEEQNERRKVQEEDEEDEQQQHDPSKYSAKDEV